MSLMPKLNWTTVKNFGRVKYFNISYIVLIAVPILAEMHYKAATSSEKFAQIVAFPLTLRWLYGASLSYAIAIALYQYFCPTSIKTYEAFENYVEKHYDLFLRALPHHRLSVVLTNLDAKLDSDIKRKITELLERIEKSEGEDYGEAQRELDKILLELHPHSVQTFLINDWDHKNRKFQFAIWLSLLLYLVGTIIVVILLFKRTVHVFNLL